MHKFKTALVAALALLILGACGSKQSSQNEAAAEDGQEIRLATSPGPYSDLFLDLVKPLLEEDGYQVTTVEFTDLREADVALEEKAAALNIEQHTLYMENFNEEKDAHLPNIQALPTVPMAIFPGQKNSFDSLEAGDQVGVPDDPSNLSRALLLLEKEGLIRLDPNADKANLNVEHITENPKNLKIEVISSPNLARTTPDLALAAIPGSRAFDAASTSRLLWPMKTSLQNSCSSWSCVKKIRIKTGSKRFLKLTKTPLKKLTKNPARPTGSYRNNWLRARVTTGD